MKIDDMKINGMSISDFVRKQRLEGEVIESINAVDCITNYDSDITTRIIHHGSVTITRKGHMYSFSGDKIEQRADGEWYVDGKHFDFGEAAVPAERCEIHIEINGSVDMVKTEYGEVTVHGDCHSINTMSGDVTCQKAGNIHTMSGDVFCKGTPLSVSTMSGDINC